MRRSLFLICVTSLLFSIIACDKQSTGSPATDSSSSTEEQELVCEFIAEGKTYSGRASTQLFPATKEYSVLCQSSGDDGKLVQFVFRDETSARNGTSFKIVNDKATSAEGNDEVSLTFDNVYVSSESSMGSVGITKKETFHEIQFTNVALAKMSGEAATVSGKVQF